MLRYLIPIEFSGVGFKHFHIAGTLDNSYHPVNLYRLLPIYGYKGSKCSGGLSAGDAASITIRHGERFVSLDNDHTVSKISLSCPKFIS